MSIELAYSLHLGSDKNRKTSSKEIAESNSPRTTSFSNNGIQTAKQLSKVNNHNLRKYDNDTNEIRTTIINMAKYKTILLTGAMITELAPEEQNKVAIFLLNSYNI